MQISTLTDDDAIVEVLSALKDNTQSTNKYGVKIRQGFINEKEVVTFDIGGVVFVVT